MAARDTRCCITMLHISVILVASGRSILGATGAVQTDRTRKARKLLYHPFSKPQLRRLEDAVLLPSGVLLAQNQKG